MIKKKNNFIAKKKFKKNVEIIKENNSTAIEILEKIKVGDLQASEVHSEISDIQTHLENMNVLFAQMENMKK